MIDSKKIEAFKKDVLTLCIKYYLSISHEDTQGAFEIVEFDKECYDWFKDAEGVEDGQ